MSGNTENLFAADGFFWWVGVVKDRMDPLKLGRCRVRILGYHLDNDKELPTEDLPWAMPMQPVFSAAISGKGQSPLGPLEGTWVIGFFADGREMQQPIIMGTIGGSPGGSLACEQNAKQKLNFANATRDLKGNIIKDQNGNSIPVIPQSVDAGATASKAITTTLPSMGQADIQNVMDFIAKQESSSIAGGVQNYTTKNTQGYVGKYQFGAAALQTNGYVRATIPPRPRANSELNDANIWTGKDGVNSLDDWLANKNNCQENAMFANMNFNYEELKRLEVIDSAASSKEEIAGYLAAAHLLGAGGARDLSIGINKADGNGTRASKYYGLGVQAVGGSNTSTPVIASAASPTTGINPYNPAQTNWAGALNNPRIGNPDPFADPNSVYPKCDYTNRADTNQLATNDDTLTATPLGSKEKTRINEIATANSSGGTGGGVWAEPPSAYAAKYPYNHVKETESGHIVEFDDTPNAERIHVYHKSGTFVEIDKDGTVSYKVKGENFQIYTRNNRVYTQGNMDVTVDGAKTLLVKDALNVEVLGKTVVNLRNDADLNVAGNLNMTVGGNFDLQIGGNFTQSIGGDFTQEITGDVSITNSGNFDISSDRNLTFLIGTDMNIQTNNYLNMDIGGDLGIVVGGDLANSVSGYFDVDASAVNLNSGFASPFSAFSGAFGLSNVVGGIAEEFTGGLLSEVASSLGVSETFVNSLTQSTGVAGNTLGKGISGMVGDFTKVVSRNLLSGRDVLSGTILTKGSTAGLLTGLGLRGLDGILQSGGFESLGNYFAKVGLGNVDIVGVLSRDGVAGLNKIAALAGFNNIESILENAGVALPKIIGNASPLIVDAIFANINSTNPSVKAALSAGDNIINNYIKNGVGRIDTTFAKITGIAKVDATEFKDWAVFPAVAQLSRHFTLGDLTTRVSDPAMQFPLTAQGNLTKYDIIGNLKSLSVNSLDPIKQQYPNLQISDAFRPTAENIQRNYNDNNSIKALYTTVLRTDLSAEAQTKLKSVDVFNAGNAANLHFKGVTAADYFDIAVWVRDNVAFDQLRLEYSTLGTSEPWITIVNNPSGNRSPFDQGKVVTTMNGRVIANHLVDLSS
jgi:hypothetical protein